MTNPSAQTMLAGHLETYGSAYRAEWKTATPCLSWEEFDLVVAALRAASAPGAVLEKLYRQHITKDRIWYEEVLPATPEEASTAAGEAVAWFLERQLDPSFPRVMLSRADADALLSYNNVNPPIKIKPLGFIASAAPPAAQTDGVREIAIEECAKLIEPEGQRPCDCQGCYCGNRGDAEAVAAWDADASNAKAVRSLAVSRPERQT